VDSILAQNDAEASVVVDAVLIDDASTDASPEICRGYAERYPDLVTLLHTEGVGVSEARNIGVRAASGDCVAFADSDDILLPGALKFLAEILSRHPECRIASGMYTQKRTSLRRGCFTTCGCIPKRGSSHRCGEDVRVHSAAEAIELTLYQRRIYHPSAWAKLYRREVFDSNMEWFVKGRRYEDLEAFPRLYKRAVNVAVSPREVYYYRPNPVSFINTFTPARYDTLWATESILEYVKREFPSSATTSSSPLSSDSSSFDFALLRRAALSRRFSALYNIYNITPDPTVRRAVRREIRALSPSILRDSRSRLKNRLAALLRCLIPSPKENSAF
jgi:glycosyltransferase involved in cell wall biosynthesis